MLSFNVSLNGKKLCLAGIDKRGVLSVILSRCSMGFHFEALCARVSSVVEIGNHSVRLFSEISKNWQGRPLKSYETVLKYIRTTTTGTGLQVRARLLHKT